MSSEAMLPWLKKRFVMQLIFVLSILYSISTINVLLLFLSILPHLPGVFLRTSVLINFALISFTLAAFFSVYHIITIFRSRKRKTDGIEEKPATKEQIWNRTNPFSKVLFGLIILYSVPSIYALLWGLELAGNFAGIADDILWISYITMSFVLVISISAFHHVTTTILRRKRRGDRLPDTKNQTRLQTSPMQ